MNDTHKLQEFFHKYIKCDNLNKNEIIFECKKSLPNQEILIDRIRKIVDNLNNNEISLYSFINNVFDIKNDTLRMDLIENLESQIENKTQIIDKFEKKDLIIKSLNNFEIEKYTDNFLISKNDIININGINKKIIRIDDEDTRFYNYIVESLLGYDSEKIFYAEDEKDKYLITNEKLQENSTDKLIKEEAICSTKEIEYFIDRITEDMDKQKYVNRIFLDLITNQNYRDLSDGNGILNSDLSETDYYVINNATLKKEIAVESLYKNYYNEIRKTSNLIMQNYDLIISIIDKIYRSDLKISKDYLKNLKSNFELAYEKGKIRESLAQIETGKSVSYIKNENYESNLLIFEKSLNLSLPKVLKKEMKNQGYTSIFILLGSIITFGILFAYLILKI